MSSPLAIAGVTAVLRDLLVNGLIDHDLSPSVGDVTVSALPPDRIIPNNDQYPSQLNLFLYQVVPNSGWRNAGFPSRNGRGDRLSNPPLALDLHYLLTAYGALNFHAEILLGYGMHLLHETAVLSRDAIRTALVPPSPASAGGGLPDHLALLSTSNLADQVEQIKITPLTLNTEELSRLWSAFQTHYRPTVAYQVSVVLIEGQRSTHRALPVQSRHSHVLTLHQPFIESLSPQLLSPGGELKIQGYNLKAEDVEVRFGEASVVPPDSAIADDEITATVPTGLRAGINTVQVVHRLDLGTPHELHRGFESNVAAFMLRPTFTFGTLQNHVNHGDDIHSADLPLTFDPLVGKTQRVLLLLNEFNPPTTRNPFAYSFEAPLRNQPSDPSATASITFHLDHVHAASYLLRVQVDSAESALLIDAGSGLYVKPKVSIP